MFTGIVEAMGTLAEVKATASGRHVRVQTVLARELTAGDSLAVNGVCLTTTVVDGIEAHFDIGPETARITTLGTLPPGERVNLERPLKLDGRLGGHLVLGHVDGIGTVEDIRPEAESHWITIGFPRDLAAFFIRKGPVAVDGVSLTIAGLGGTEFDVQIIPFTLSATTLGRLRRGDRVNLECDMIGKYVVRALDLAGGCEERRTQERRNEERGNEERRNGETEEQRTERTNEERRTRT
jgi:riboflavin synthase